MPAKKKTAPQGSTKKAPLKHTPSAVEGALFDRVVGILEQARAGVVRAVNSHMVIAYWLIGREIVQEIQGGKGRAAYGQAVLADLSRKLTARYGAGFSETTLQYFRKFYQVYADRCPQIPRPTGVESSMPGLAPPIPRPLGVDSVSTPPSAARLAIRHPAGDELSGTDPSAAIQHSAGAESSREGIQRPMGAELALPEKGRPAGDELVRGVPPPTQDPAGSESLVGFSPQLNWSHYRALMRVEKLEAREFYEQEAIAGGWDKRTLERQIQTSYFERLLKSQHPQKMLTQGRQELTTSEPAIGSLKNPYVLEFLGLPEVAALHESDLEGAILSYLQTFLLELGNGFAFVARQKRLRFGDDDRYVDLVFYHCRLKFYLLIDLKLGELTHGDVGQMDGYVRMFDDLVASDGDNPTIGLILCTEKNETVAKYSVLNDRQQIFASKYMLYLPTEEELQREIERERRLIENTQREEQP